MSDSDSSEDEKMDAEEEEDRARAESPPPVLKVRIILQEGKCLKAQSDTSSLA